MQTTGALYCLQDSSKEAGLDPLPEPLAEPEVTDDGQLSTLLGLNASSAATSVAADRSRQWLSN